MNVEIRVNADTPNTFFCDNCSELKRIQCEDGSVHYRCNVLNANVTSRRDGHIVKHQNCIAAMYRAILKI